MIEGGDHQISYTCKAPMTDICDRYLVQNVKNEGHVAKCSESDVTCNVMKLSQYSVDGATICCHRSEYQ